MRQGRFSAVPTTLAPEASKQALLEALEERIGQEACQRYFHDANLDVAEEGVVVRVGSTFVADLMARRFTEPLRDAAAQVTSTGDVRFQVDRQSPARPLPAPESKAPRRTRRRPALRHSLDDFVVGRANELAYAAALRLTEPDCQGNFARLVIHGGCGLGKTHLLQGIAQRFEAGFPGSTVRYVTSESFTNEFIQAVRGDRVESFRQAYRGVDLLCVDDVHFLSSKQATQEELLHTFDALDLAGARVAMASDEHPKCIRRLNRALVSRCMSGMIVQLEPPDRELTVELSVAIARRRGLRLNADAALLVAETLCRTTRKRPASVREIEGVITRIEAVWRLTSDGANEVIGVAMVRRALGMDADAITSARRRSVSVNVIATEVCAELGVDVAELHATGRHQRVVLARSMTAYLSRRLTNKSYPEIARAMARPSHSTVVTACKRMERQIAEGDAVSTTIGGQRVDVPLEDLANKLTHAIAQAAAHV